ncbi:MAG: DUF3990 domain-containing protein [Bacilli bacterium]|nr:DUF3990 domain-containing protein [Bacilli bacterium]
MNNYYARDCKSIRECFGITQTELSEQTGVSRVTLARLETNAHSPSPTSLEGIYSFAYENGMMINEDHADIMDDDKKDRVLVFHGSKNQIKGSVSLEHSKGSNDFGKGFYAGESFAQAATFISSFRSHFVYAFYLNMNGLKTYEFSADLEWMLAISFFRGRLKEYENHPIITGIINKIKGCDVIIAPIADNSMYETLNEFADKEITDEQCRHSIRANYLGKQYVFLTDKALAAIGNMNEMYLPENEKEIYKKQRIEQFEASKNKTELAKLNYRRKGKYIDEIFFK